MLAIRSQATNGEVSSQSHPPLAHERRRAEPAASRWPNALVGHIKSDLFGLPATVPKPARDRCPGIPWTRLLSAWRVEASRCTRL